MLERHFQTGYPVRRYRSVPVTGPYFDGLLERMQRLGYSTHRIRTYFRALEEFGYFLARRRVVIDDLEEAHLAAFLKSCAANPRGRPWQTPSNLRPPITFLLEWLRETGDLRCAQDRAHSSDEQIVLGHLSFLRAHLGLQERTLARHRLHVERFVQHLRKCRKTVATASVRDIDRFMTRCGGSMARRTLKQVAGALRAFFRHLHLSGQSRIDLSPHVPSPRVYQLESVPRARPWQEVMKLLCGPDRKTVAGRRDYAVLMLLICYGLRAGEIASLGLKDIDWEHDRLLIRQTKTGEPRTYPLHSRVGASILRYLKHGRPASSHREIFLTLSAPIRPFPGGDNVSTIVQRHAARVGLTEPERWRAHLIRHSYAVNLLRKKFTLKAIGDMLGHRNPSSTYIYAKADLDDLRSVAVDVSEFVPNET
jgi:site-specific recombinase XerD